MKQPVYYNPPVTRTDVEGGPMEFFTLLKALVDGGHLLGLSPIELRVLLILLRYRNGTTGYSWPSLKTLTRFGASNKRDVIRALRRLSAKGLIRRVKRGGGRGNSTVWMIVVPAMETVAVKAPVSIDKGLRSQHENGGERRNKGLLSQHEKGCSHSHPNNKQHQNNNKPTPRNGVDGFDFGDGKEDRKTSEAVTYLIDLGVNRETVLAALKQFGPEHIGAVAALGVERDGDDTLTNIGGLLANKLRRGPTSLNGNGKMHANRNGHKKFLNKNRCEAYDPERPELFQKMNKN